MGIPSVNYLGFLESQLYPYGTSYNQNCPSFANGYFAGANRYALNSGSIFPAYQQYHNSLNTNTPSFQGTHGATQAQSGQNGQNGVGFGASQSDLDILGDNYVKGMRPSESLMGAAAGGAVFGMINNLRWFAHPYNSIMAAKSTNGILKEMGNVGTELNKFWKNPETNQLARDFYYRVHKLEGMNPELRRLPFAKKQLSEGTYKQLLEEAKRLAGNANPTDKEWLKKVAALNEKIRIANDAQTGWLNQGWQKIKGIFTDKAGVKSVEDRLKNTDAIETAAKKALEKQGSKLTIGKALKHSCGWKSAALWIGMELLMGLGNISTAFKAQNSGKKEYENAGWKQLGQTIFKGAGSAAGWAVGEGLGTWAGAAIGTAIAPGIGTAIGAVAGMIGGSIGMWLTGKLTQGIVGDDIATKIEADNLKKTPEGQVQLLQHTIQQIQDGKKVDPRTMMAAQNVMNVYA